ncbi:MULTISPECIES: hypothetical protein [Helicobacter]|uniref:Uncharacterized protein n=1 Tax=Helicobacter bilis ATCC 43879 TaxID=613026 RepID=C3XGE2_9HELI|nr:MULTISPECIES: hypothetical protein [Helicobacter]EEO24081.1 hypothetical protein HRAG_01138 [Helicobacter bilis ATCC 43879]
MRLTTKAIVTALLATLPPISLFGAGVKLVKGENAKDTNIYYLPDDYKKKLDGGAYEEYEGRYLLCPNNTGSVLSSLSQSHASDANSYYKDMIRPNSSNSFAESAKKSEIFDNFSEVKKFQTLRLEKVQKEHERVSKIIVEMANKVCCEPEKDERGYRKKNECTPQISEVEFYKNFTKYNKQLQGN